MNGIKNIVFPANRSFLSNMNNDSPVNVKVGNKNEKATHKDIMVQLLEKASFYILPLIYITFIIIYFTVFTFFTV